MSLKTKSAFHQPDLEGLNQGVNPYVSYIVESKDDFPHLAGSRLKEWANDWPRFFASRRLKHEVKEFAPRKGLVVEIGCHRGKTLDEMAGLLPEHDFIGMDITYKRVFLSAKRLYESQKTNAVACFCNAKYMDSLFEENTLAGVYAFFPDPFVKKRSQRKHMLFNEEFCNVIIKLLRAGGEFWIKTDQKSYFDAIIDVCLRNGLCKASEEAFLGSTKPLELGSHFERKFTSMGLPTFGAILRKSHH